MFLLSICQMYFLSIVGNPVAQMTGVGASYSMMFLIYTLVYGYEIELLKQRIGTAEEVTFDVMLLDGTPLPEYQSVGAAGFDLTANVGTPFTLYPGDRQLIPTGLKVALPIGNELDIRPRSGLALKHGISVVNAPGTIDCDFRGEIGVILINQGDEPFIVSKGERIAQAVMLHPIRANMQPKSSLDKTARGSKGFGHTGK